MGQLWDIVQAHIDSAPYPPSERQVAAKLGVSPTALSKWRAPKRLPDVENLRSLARLAGVPYSTVLEAALADTGYKEVVGNAEHPAPMKEAGETPAADDSNVHEFRGRLVSRETWDEDAATFSERAVASENEALEEEGIAQLENP